MHTDRPVHAIVHHQHQHIAAILHRGGEFLPIHHEIAIACQRDDHLVGATQGGRNSGRRAIAHGTRRWCQLRPRPAIGPIAMPPAREIARTIAEDAIRRQRVAHRRDALAKVQLGFKGGRGVPRNPVLMRLSTFGQGRGRRGQGRCRLSKARHIRTDRKVCPIHAVELIGVRVNMDQRLARMIRGDQRIAISCRFAQSCANRQY